MRSKFKWYLSKTKEEIEKVWDEALLSVDANVLLDMYRYHENTRNSLLGGLKSFKGRAWISNQAATEFFRNRNKVIASSETGFKDAGEALKSIRKDVGGSISKLRGNRIISEDAVNVLEEKIEDVISSAEEDFRKVKDNFPNFMKEDSVLEELLELFDGAVGPEFSDAESEIARKEAERRQKNEVPPGYMDKGKDGERPFGDYYMWRQILAHAKSEARPVIFVTSERKEDWWERVSGKTVGPRQELIKEAYEFTSGQPVLIYQTDRFLEFVNEKFGRKADSSAVEEIRQVSRSRDRLPAVNFLYQYPEEQSLYRNRGEIAIELTREVQSLTASGHFDPALLFPPAVKVSIRSAPDGIPASNLFAKTGTDYDFNIHLHSTELNSKLPKGLYVFDYDAQVRPVEDLFGDNEISGVGDIGIDFDRYIEAIRKYGRSNEG